MFTKMSSFSTVTAFLAHEEQLFLTACQVGDSKLHQRYTRPGGGEKQTACKTQVSFNTSLKSIRLLAVFPFVVAEPLRERTAKVTFLNWETNWSLSKCHSVEPLFGILDTSKEMWNLSLSKYEGEVRIQDFFIIFLWFLNMISRECVLPLMAPVVVSVRQKKRKKKTWHWTDSIE